MQGDCIYENVILDYLNTGSIKETAYNMKLSVVKVRRILITEDLWTSRSSAAIGRLYAQGETVAQIAHELCISEKNVQAYIPYSRGLYNGQHRSVSALNSEDYRKRIRTAQQRTLKRIEKYFEEEGWESIDMDKIEKKEFSNVLSGEGAAISEQFPGRIGGREFPQEMLQEATRKYGRFDMLRLHLELVADWWNEKDKEEAGRVLHEYGEVQYGDTISRDIIVPANIPLYALHYVIQRAFGWENSHLHDFELPEEQYYNVTGGKAGQWLKLVGILFRSPIMDDSDRFWADDYEQGSFKTWLRKKYRGPYLSLCHGEGYQQCMDDVRLIKKRAGKIRCNWAEGYKGDEFLCGAYEVRDNAEQNGFGFGKITRTEELDFNDVPVRGLDFIFENNPRMLLERIPLDALLAAGGLQLLDGKNTMAEGEGIIDNCHGILQHVSRTVKELNDTGIDSPDLQPVPAPVIHELYYSYDYGDNWKVKITGSHHCVDLIEDGRITQDELDQAILQVWETYMPVCIARDGCNVVDDVGGLHGFMGFLRAINNDTSHDNGPYEDKESSLEWAKSLGWSRRKIKNKNIF